MLEEKTSIKKTTAASKTKEESKTSSSMTIDMLTTIALDNPDNVYTDSNGKQHLYADAQLSILRNYCNLNNYRYSIYIDAFDVSIGYKTVQVRVILKHAHTGEIISEVAGISTRNTMTLPSSIKDAATEAAYTIAIGKALAIMGIHGNRAYVSSEEIALFEKSKEVDVHEIKTHTIRLISKLPESVKQDMKKANLTSYRIFQDIIDIDTTSEQFENIVNKLIIEKQSSKDN